MSEANKLFDADCERAMLATVWLADDAAMVLNLDEKDFVEPFNAWLFRHLRALVESEQPLDMVALLRRLRRPRAFDGLTQLEVDGHKGMIAEVLTTWAPPSRAEFYFAALRTERQRRMACRMCERALERLKENQDPVAVLSWLVANAERALTKTPVKSYMAVQEGV